MGHIIGMLKNSAKYHLALLSKMGCVGVTESETLFRKLLAKAKGLYSYRPDKLYLYVKVQGCMWLIYPKFVYSMQP